MTVANMVGYPKFSQKISVLGVSVQNVPRREHVTVTPVS